MTALMTLQVGPLSLLQRLLMPPILKCPVTCMRALGTPMPLRHVMSSPELEGSVSAVFHQFVETLSRLWKLLILSVNFFSFDTQPPPPIGPDTPHSRRF